MRQRVRVGVIGCGLIAQVMHLPYLAELGDRFEIGALCDVSSEVASACAERYGVARVHTDWGEMIDGGGLDAVLVLTYGSHAPMAVAAARAGLHALVEKPMGLSVAECREMVDAAAAAGTVLMVGTMKRYDPAAERLAALVGELDDLRLVRVTTLESPISPYIAHYPLVHASPARGRERPELPRDGDLAAQQAADEERVARALPDADENTRWCYRRILLDSLVHELNLLRATLGEPTEVTHAELSTRSVGLSLHFGATACHLSWVDLPGIARYSQELAFYAPDRRLTLTFPSPFLRSMPTRLTVEGGTPGTTEAWARDEQVAFDEAFKRELVELHDCIRDGRTPRTSGEDGLRDVALCASIARVHATREPEQHPTRTADQEVAQ